MLQVLIVKYVLHKLVRRLKGRELSRDEDLICWTLALSMIGAAGPWLSSSTH